jgi:hypothetical protein
VVPWLIATPGWPELVAHVMAATARLAADPALAVGATVGAGACTGATALCRRVGLLPRRARSG